MKGGFHLIFYQTRTFLCMNTQNRLYFHNPASKSIFFQGGFWGLMTYSVKVQSGYLVPKRSWKWVSILICSTFQLKRRSGYGCEKIACFGCPCTKISVFGWTWVKEWKLGVLDPPPQKKTLGKKNRFRC